MSTDFQTLTNNNTSFTPGQKAKLFISNLYQRGATIPTKTVTADGAVAIGDTTLGLGTAINVTLYEGTRIEFLLSGVSTPVYVSTLTESGATSIPIEPSKYAIPNDSDGVIHAWIPYFSANQVNLDNTATVIAEQNFSAGLYTQKAVTQLDGKATTQGIQVYNDPGLVVLSRANSQGDQVVVEFVKPFQRGVRRFEAIIGGLPENVQKNAFITQSCNLEASGEVIKYEN
jgi:hypothetical protein